MHCKQIIVAVGLGCMAMCVTTDALAADRATPAGKDPFPYYDSPPKTRQDAIKRVQARLAVLQNMSDTDWEEYRKQVQEQYMEAQRRRATIAHPQQQGVPAAQAPRSGLLSPALRERIRQQFQQR